MRIVLAVAASIALLVEAASACQPEPPWIPPPPEFGEAQETYDARIAAMRAAQEAEREQAIINEQRQLWEGAESVLLARVVRTATVNLDFGPSPRAYLQPLDWLKGRGPSRTFFVNQEGWTSCGPYGGGHAVGGEVGEIYLVFVREGRPNMRNILTTLALNAVKDPELLERLEEPHAGVD